MNFYPKAISAPANTSSFKRSPMSICSSAILWTTAFLLHGLWADPALASQTATEPPAEQLVLFTQDDASSEIARQFEKVHWPALQQAADELGLPIRRLDVRGGIPEEARITPFLAFQSARGRSIFQGRYTDMGKVKHFVRTSRAIPALSETVEKGHVAVLEQERSRAYAPLKITDLAGEVPADFDQDAFRQRAEKAILAGLSDFKTWESISLGPSDRAFYMDFYPYWAKGGDGSLDAGTLYISVALFSQFNCIDPVFQPQEAAAQGSFSDLENVFARAARVLEQEVSRQIQNSDIGDGFDPIPKSVVVKSWEELGLALPKLEGSIDPASAALPLERWPRKWRMAEAKTDTPRLIFRFPSPLERYSGEVSRLSGTLTLPEGRALVGADGKLEARTASVTMGEDSLDQAIHTKMIYIAKFPDSHFELDRFLPDTESLAFGRAARFSAEGRFTLMGHEVPIFVRGDVEPVTDEEGEPRLRIRAAFELRLAVPFGIAGPDGPAPANDTLKFYLDFQMEADSDRDPSS